MNLKKLLKNGTLLGLITAIISAPFAGLVHADEKQNITPNETAILEMLNKSAEDERLGGGPSPSAVWEVKSSATKTLTKAQIISLNDKAEKAQKSGKLSNDAFTLCLTIAGYMSGITPYMATFLSFQNTHGTLVSKTLDTVRLALVNMEKTKQSSCKVILTTYHRPASGEKLVVATGIVK